ncbi:Mrp/NBP35 family ATP-binding protein [Christensenellaceae bacterium OttesenSCG-928-K19]|nr:Mrp/NBP35 family ATP-binding protein [Christensenellaceae bacterium OttesenSCG-928-K19]
MTKTCNGECSACGVDCEERKESSFVEKPHELSSIKRVIGVVSGKGGVGKSLVTSMLAVAAQRRGNRVAILDADITGPSIPQAFGIKEKASGNEMGMFPVKSKNGISIMSVNLLLENETDPVIWRGPILAGTVKQFWTDVIWNDVDCMFVDLPPGTGDVPLTVFQSIPLDGIVIVTTPQELVGMIVDKAVTMANMMKIPVLAVIENMSGFKCPGCGEIHNIFGESRIEAVAAKHGIETVSRILINPKLAAAVDSGEIESFEEEVINDLINSLGLGKGVK